MLKKKPTLDGVLSGFRKNIEDLETITANNNETQAKNKNVIVSLEEQNTALEAETKTAQKVKDNLSKLIGE